MTSWSELPKALNKPRLSLKTFSLFINFNTWISSALIIFLFSNQTDRQMDKCNKELIFRFSKFHVNSINAKVAVIETSQLVSKWWQLWRLMSSSKPKLIHIKKIVLLYGIFYSTRNVLPFHDWNIEIYINMILISLINKKETSLCFTIETLF